MKDVAHIREQMRGIEAWMERVTDTLTRLAENQQQVALLDLRIAAQSKEIGELKNRILESEKLLYQQQGQIIRLLAWAMILGPLALVVIPVLLSWMAGAF